MGFPNQIENFPYHSRLFAREGYLLQSTFREKRGWGEL
jgi:hypothetical protein